MTWVTGCVCLQQDGVGIICNKHDGVFDCRDLTMTVSVWENGDSNIALR